MRGHENPALDVARASAHRLGLRLVVASFLLYSHTFPTLRRFKYMLEGFQDTQQELRAQVHRLPDSIHRPDVCHQTWNTMSRHDTRLAPEDGKEAHVYCG